MMLFIFIHLLLILTKKLLVYFVATIYATVNDSLIFYNIGENEMWNLQCTSKILFHLISRPHFDRVDFGGHDDPLQGSCQPGGDLGLSLQPLWSGVVLKPCRREEVVDHCQTIVLA